MTANLYFKIIAEHSKEEAIKRLFSFVEVKRSPVDHLKIICICKIKSPRADKAHARHGDAFDAVSGAACRTSRIVREKSQLE